MTQSSPARGCRRSIAILPVLLCALAACHTAPVVERPPAAREPAQPAAETPAPPPALSADELPPDSAVEVPIETPEVPPCLPPEAAPPKRRSKPRPEPPPPIAPPAGTASTAPGANDAQVKPLGSPVTTVLGKKVEGVKGEDLGRVVDVLADASGRVRVAIIEFGGFLGVGNRRIAVDWSLLRFDPVDQNKPLILSVSRKKLQSAPEYKNAPQPQALVAQPSAAPAPAPATTPTPPAAAPTPPAAAPTPPAAAPAPPAAAPTPPAAAPAPPAAAPTPPASAPTPPATAPAPPASSAPVGKK